MIAFAVTAICARTWTVAVIDWPIIVLGRCEATFILSTIIVILCVNLNVVGAIVIKILEMIASILHLSWA